MKVVTITLTVLLINFISYSQSSLKDSLFSQALYANIKTYKLAADNAYLNHKDDTGEVLFEQFVERNLVNTYLDNFKAKNKNGALLTINNYFKKPVILITYASWCIREEQEIDLLNDFANLHKDKIDFVIVFWDNKNTARKKAKIFNKNIHVLYIDERENIFSSEIKNMKHALGLSLVYYISRENRIVSIKKNDKSIFNTKHKYNTTFTQNENEFINGLNTLLIYDETHHESIALD